MSRTSVVGAAGAALTLAGALVLVPGTPGSTAHAAPEPARAAAAEPGGKYAADRVLVEFQPGATDAHRAAALASAAASGPTPVENTSYVSVTVSAGVPYALGRLRAHSAVATAAPVYERTASAVPRDPAFSRRQSGPAKLLRLPTAWDIRKTSSVVIAVVDTGVDLKHPDLRGRLVQGRDFVDGDAKPQDENGHGTQVAGVIGAVPNNKRGVAGVVWNARIMPVRVLDADGNGFDDTIARGIVWAANHGADVINVSLGGPEANEVLRAALRYAHLRGAVVVVAAGNDGTDTVQYPAGYPEALAVGATDDRGALTLFSSYGDWVDVAAPGWNIHSTALRYPGSSDYASESGTSFSAPYVSGIAALLRAAHPSWSAERVERRIMATARDAGAAGYDEFYGFGVVDATAALGGPTGRRIPRLGKPDANDSPAHAVSAVSATATIGTEGDVDWFRYRAPGPMWARVTVSGGTSYPDTGPSALAPFVSIYDGQLRPLRGDGGDDVGKAIVLDVWFAGAGDYFLNVRNAFPCRSSAKYSVKVAPVTNPKVHFSPAAALYVDAQSGGTAIGDITGDDTPDLVLSSAASFGGPAFLTVVDGKRGHLTDERTYYDTKFFWPHQGAVAIGDVTGDGRNDVVLGTDVGAQLFAQTTKGRLKDSGLIPGTIGGTVAVVQMDGGARVVAQTRDRRRGPTGLAVFRRSGTTWEHDTLDDVTAAEIEVGDLDNNGHDDIAVVDGSPTVTIFSGNGSAFMRSTIIPSGTEIAGALDVGDVTGDGLADLITTGDRHADKAAVVLLRQEAGGLAFGEKATYSGGNGPVDSGDVNGDGRPDIVITGTRGLVVFRADANGQLSPPSVTRLSPTDMQSSPNGQAVGDLDGDELAEVVSRTAAFTYVLGHQQPVPGIVLGHSPSDGQRSVGRGVKPTITLARPVEARTVGGRTVRLVNGTTRQQLPVSVTYDAATRVITVHPARRLAAGTPYTVIVAGVTDSDGVTYTDRFTFTTAK